MKIDLKACLVDIITAYDKILLNKNEILDAMESVLFPLVYDTMNITKEDTEWKNVFSKGNMIYFIGLVPVNTGSGKLVDENGDELNITEENAHLYKSILRIGIPIDMVIRENSEEILAFFKDNADEDGVSSDAGVPVDDEALLTYVGSGDNVMDSFDMSELTDEQLLNLNLTHKGRLN